MALRIVGTGFGRTGTSSLKTALESLGFGLCHHMFEVRRHPEELPFWQSATDGRMPDWDAVFANYGACLDWPSAVFWREIADHFSDAKVLLTVRPEEDWYRSIHATIYQNLTDQSLPDEGLERDRRLMVRELILNQQFGGQLGNREKALEIYRNHIDEVKRTIAPERLLTYDVAQGWEPLCDFLEVPVPDEPFPLQNTTREFQERAAARRQQQQAS